MNYDLNNLQSPPAVFRSRNSLDRDPRDSHEESGHESIIIADSEEEDSEIEFSEGSDDKDDRLTYKLFDCVSTCTCVNF